MKSRRTESQWRAIFNRYDRSGLSQEQFCKREGLSLTTFAMWRRKIRAASSSLATQPSSFVEVCIPDSVKVTEVQVPDVRPDLVVELPYGVVLRFHGVKP